MGTLLLRVAMQVLAAVQVLALMTLSSRAAVDGAFTSRGMTCSWSSLRLRRRVRATPMRETASSVVKQRSSEAPRVKHRQAAAPVHGPDVGILSRNEPIFAFDRGSGVG